MALYPYSPPKKDEMKTHIALSLLLLSVSLHAQSDDYLPFLSGDDKVWTVLSSVIVTDSVGNILHTDTITYVYQLAARVNTGNGYESALRRGADSLGIFDPTVLEPFGKFTEINRAVYYEGPMKLYQVGNKVFDFSLAVGDTLMRAYDDISQPTDAVVETKDTVLFADQVPRVRFGVRFHSYSSYQDTTYLGNRIQYYVEGLGDLRYGPFFQFVVAQWNRNALDELLCFIQNGEVVYKNPRFAAEPDCYFERIMTPVRESPVRELRGLFPNPARDVLSLDLPRLTGPATAVIYDLRGRAVARRQLGTMHSGDRLEWQLPALAAGVYVLVIEDEAGIWRGKFVKR